MFISRIVHRVEYVPRIPHAAFPEGPFDTLTRLVCDLENIPPGTKAIIFTDVAVTHLAGHEPESPPFNRSPAYHVHWNLEEAERVRTDRWHPALVVPFVPVPAHQQGKVWCNISHPSQLDEQYPTRYLFKAS